MPTHQLQTDAIILLKRPPTESFQGFTAFAEEHGIVVLQQRLPKTRPSPAARTAGGPMAFAPLDLFDEASLLLESSNQGRTWFVREARLLTRPVGIGRCYAALEHASGLARLVARNAVPEEGRATVAHLLRTTFAAFASGVRPDVTHFKGLYLFAREEGYPLRQHWFVELSGIDQAKVAALLSQPLAEQSATPEEVDRLRHRLEDYLRHHTEILPA